MPIPGYDPADVDEMLEERLTDEEKASLLTDEEWESYQHGDDRLVDLLEPSEIERVLDQHDGESDGTE